MLNKNKKKPLNESQVLRWGTLANIQTLSERFVKENFEAEKQEESVEQEESLKEEFPPSAGGMGDDEEIPQPEPQMEPDGDEMGGVGEPDIQSLVKAIADAITAQTGVQVGVQGGAPGAEEMPPEEMPEPEMDAGGAEEEMPPMGETSRLHQLAKAKQKYGDVKKESEVDERMGHRDHGGAHYQHGQPQESKQPQTEGKKVNKKVVKEEFSNSPKVTKQNVANQGTVKDPGKGSVRVQGVEKPAPYLGQTSAGYPHKMKAMEEQLVKRVLERLLQELHNPSESPINKGPNKTMETVETTEETVEESQPVTSQKPTTEAKKPVLKKK